jgi:alpha-mannosidase
MWVESDTNLPGGESLVRQLLYGMRFWLEEFGFTPEMVWLPDVFGYSAQIPQLMKQAGLPYFLTIKLSWNAVNKFPYASFRWQGLDGSEVLAHMPPEGNYNSAARADSFRRAVDGCYEKNIFPGSMLLYGIGDGGGGPGMEHLERLSREKDLLGLPKVKESFAQDFFRELAPFREKLPAWKGELYLEKHQGTYTSQGRTKKGNRLCEKYFHEIELLASMALRLRKGYVYPKARMDALWQEALLYQFHDILPGSCIARVYVEAEARYAEMLEELQGIKAELLACLLTGEGETVFNASS